MPLLFYHKCFSIFAYLFVYFLCARSGKRGQVRANYYVHRFFLRPTFSGTANFGASEYGIFSSIFSTLLNVKVNYNYQKAVTSKKNKQNIFSYNNFVDLNVNHVEMERSEPQLEETHEIMLQHSNRLFPLQKKPYLPNIMLELCKSESVSIQCKAKIRRQVFAASNLIKQLKK